MVVLADELLESFFETDLSSSFRLDSTPAAPLPEATSGFFGGLLSTIATDENMKLFNKFADEFGKTIGKHTVSLNNSSSCFLAYFIFLGRSATIYWQGRARDGLTRTKSEGISTYSCYEDSFCVNRGLQSF